MKRIRAGIVLFVPAVKRWNCSRMRKIGCRRLPRIYKLNLSIQFNSRINPVRDLTHNYPPRSRSSIAMLSWIRGYHPTVLPSAHHYEAGNLNSLRQILPFDIVDWQGASPDNFPPCFATEALSPRPILPVRHVGWQVRNQTIFLRDPARPSLRLVSSGGLSGAPPSSPRPRFSSSEL